jgi:hypothetical protein
MFRHKNESEQVTENKKVIGDKKDMSTELPAVLENKKIPKTEGFVGEKFEMVTNNL